MSELALNGGVQTGGMIAIADSRKNVKAIQDNLFTTAEQMHEKEKAIDGFIDGAKKVVEVCGVALTIIMAICPFDGPIGEWAAALGTPAILGALEAGRGLLKSTIVNKDPKEMQAAFVDLKGQCKKIEMPDRNLVANLRGPKTNPNMVYSDNDIVESQPQSHTMGGM